MSKISAVSSVGKADCEPTNCKIFPPLRGRIGGVYYCHAELVSESENFCVSLYAPAIPLVEGSFPLYLWERVEFVNERSEFTNSGEGII